MSDWFASLRFKKDWLHTHQSHVIVKRIMYSYRETIVYDYFQSHSMHWYRK